MGIRSEGVVLVALVAMAVGAAEGVVHGRYTRDIHQYETLIPRKVDAEGDFVSFDLAHYFRPAGAEAGGGERRRRGAASGAGLGAGPAHVHYALALGGRELLLELWPSHDLLAPGVPWRRRRRRRRDAGGEGEGEPDERGWCHWRGRVRGGGRAAVSTCGGALAGALGDARGRRLFVEPLAGARPDAHGRLPHVAHAHAQRGGGGAGEGVESGAACGAGDWRDGWRRRFRRELLRGVAPARLRPARAPTPNAPADDGGGGGGSGPRATHARKRALELLVVADKNFIDHHKEDAENYLLTLINIASDLWRDATTGGYFSLAITRLLWLEKEVDPLELHLGRDAENVLLSFQRWAEKLNPADWSHPQHHDIAVLVTKHDLCSDNMTNCNLLGLANVAAACDPARAACINEDSGLTAGATIAHEIGHVMGAAHDAGGDPTRPDGCPVTDPDGAGWVMAAYLPQRVGVWSNCSKNYFATLMATGLGECLVDAPQGPVVKLPEVLPGVLYDADHQCKMYMNLDKVCASKRDVMCELLWCAAEGNMCSSQGRAAAAGTRCGAGRWCWGGACVAAGRRARGVDGAWGAWAAWGACSRSCGAGVEARERRCDSPQPSRLGRHCLGESRRFRVCNAQPCDAAQPDFRSAQCSAFDAKKWWVDGALHTWRPHLVPAEPCKLHCANELNTFDALADIARDGTPCRPGARDLCVVGECVAVGCDWGLQSGALEDVCGVCRGDGSHCRKEEVLWTEQGSGYVHVVTVPAGAYNVRVEETSPTTNMVALASRDGSTFCLNGANTLYPEGEYACPAGRVLLSYPEANKDLVAVKGPTKEDLTVYYAFFGQPNPGVKVWWYAQRESGEGAAARSFKWEFLEWQDCDARCGGGTQVSVAECVERSAGRVSDSFCDAASQPPPRSRVCNESPCAARWVAGEWGACSGCVFRAGLQRRPVECLRDASRAGAAPTPAPLDACAAAGPRPLDRRLCNNKARCTGGDLFQPERPARQAASTPGPGPGPALATAAQPPKPWPYAQGVITDRAPAHLFVVEEVPLVAQPAGRGLSEEAEKQVGEGAGPGVMADLAQRRRYTGAAAEQRLRQIKQLNDTE